MHGFAILKQDDAENLTYFRDPRPLPYAPVGLNLSLLWALDHIRYPFVADCGPVRPPTSVLEVLGRFQVRFSSFPSFRAENVMRSDVGAGAPREWARYRRAAVRSGAGGTLS